MRNETDWKLKAAHPSEEADGDELDISWIDGYIDDDDDEDFEEFLMGEDEILDDSDLMEMAFLDLINSLSGTDHDGNPVSHAILAVHSIDLDTEETKEEESCIFRDAGLTVMASGGAAVVEARFPKSSTAEHNRASRICQEWMKEADEEFDGHNISSLSLTIVPDTFAGSLYLVFRGLVYAISRAEADGGHTLALCFDNTMTHMYEDNDMDYGKIDASVQNEIRQEEQKLDREIAALDEMEKELENDNVYGESIRGQFMKNMELDGAGDEEGEDDDENNDGSGTESKNKSRFRFN